MACLIFLLLSLRLAFRSQAGPAFIGKLQGWLFGSLAWPTVALTLGLSLAMFLEIVRGHRMRVGFPWFPSLCFAGSSVACLLALHACLR